MDNGVVIGNNVKAQNRVNIYHGVVIEDDVFLGPSMTFTNDLYPRSLIWNDEKVVRTLVKKGASIGANATIICGNTIGRYALIGAGSVVTRDVPDHVIVVGNPARPIGVVCECGYRVSSNDVIENLNVKCGECGKRFEIPSKECLALVKKI